MKRRLKADPYASKLIRWCANELILDEAVAANANDNEDDGLYVIRINDTSHNNTSPTVPVVRSGIIFACKQEEIKPPVMEALVKYETWAVFSMHAQIPRAYDYADSNFSAEDSNNWQYSLCPVCKHY